MNEFENLQDVSIDETPHLEIVEPVETEPEISVENIEVSNNEITQQPIKVYVKRDDQGKIVEINSEIFIDNFEGWEYFDEGFGDKYAHAQSQYFDEPLNEGDQR